MKEYLGKTKNGFDVYLDKETSHASTHIAKTPKLLSCVKKIIPTIDVNEKAIRFDVNMQEEVGKTDLVETNESDEIIYAIRPLRTQYSRFVKNKQPISTTWMSVDLRKSGEKEYDLYTCFVGKLTPSFPGGNYLPDQSLDFWSKHALVWGRQEVIPGSETTECPW